MLITKYWLGKKLSVEHRQKISKSLMGNTGNLGKKATTETRAKLSKLRRARVDAEMVNGVKTCSDCRLQKPLNEFIRVKARSRLHSYCNLCGRLRSKEWRRAIREEVLRHYGARCQCCGESIYEFLAVDHVNNDGYKDVRRARNGGSAMWYVTIKRLGFPSDLQVLCHNCNNAKAFYGVCPHKINALIGV